MVSLATMQQRYDAACQTFAPAPRPYRFATSPSQDGSPHVELAGGRYHYIVTERGKEQSHKITADPDELLYWLVQDVAFGTAGSYELAHRIAGQDVRRILFAKQLALLQHANPTWAERRKAEIAATLQDHPFIDERLTFRSHALWRALALCGLLFFAAGGVIALQAVRQGETGPFFPPIFGILTSIFGYTWVAWSTAVHLDSDALIIDRLGHKTVVPYHTIIDHSANQLLTIRTAHRTRRLWFPSLDFLGRLDAALEERVRPLRAGDPQPNLPITYRNRSHFPFVMLPLGLLMWVVAGGLAWGIVEGELETAVTGRLFAICMIPLMAAIGTWAIYVSLLSFPWHFTFGQHAIRVRHTLRTQVYDAATITAISLQTETRTYRGFRREVAFIVISFNDDKQVHVESGMGAYPMDYSAVAEAKKLRELTAVLQTHYLSRS